MIPKRYILIATFSALLVAAVGYALWQRPAFVARRSVEKLAQAQTQAYILTATLENADTTRQLLGEEATIQIKIDGSFDRGTPSNLEGMMNITVQTESVSMTIEGEIRFVNDKAYILITKSPAAFPLLVSLKGAWLELPRGNQEESQSVEIPDELFQDVSRAQSIEVNGEKLPTYTAQATKNAAISLLDGIAQILGTNLTQEQIDQISQGVESIESVPVTLAITRWTHELRRVQAQVTLPSTNTLNFDLTLTDRNKPVEIAAPAEAATLQELLAPAASPAAQ